jgi:Tol biopolymer transport system component/DNA-binding winged helix-turn-helix (wHTH) protein
MSATSLPPLSAVGKFRFGVFEADPQAGELRKFGMRIRIQSQPLQILQLLLERSGEVVSREEIQRKFWEQNTMVDLDQSLATAIHKIRVCLGDSVTQPRYIETLARNGYRFIAPVTVLDPARPATDSTSTSERDLSRVAAVTAIPGVYPVKEEESVSAMVPSGLAFLPASLHSRLGALILGLCIALLTAGAYFAGIHVSQPAASIARIVPITSSGRASPVETGLEGFSEMATDGSRVYFPEIREGRVELAEVAAAGGDTAPVGLPTELGEPSLEDLSPDDFHLLLRNHRSTTPEHPLWIASTTGQAAHQIPGVLAHAAVWTPSGGEIVYAFGDDLWLAHDDGTANRKLVTLPGRAFWIRWSPDGKRLRFTVVEDRLLTTSLWEAGSDGSGAHPLFLDWTPAATCCGSWTADGRYFTFQATTAGRGSLWSLPASSAMPGANARPILIADGPLSYESPTPSRAGHDLFFLGVDNKTEMMQLGSDGQGLQQASAAFHNASGVEFSHDGSWVAWIISEDGSLWRSRSDGTDRLQLVGAPFEVSSMRWSPDGKQLAVMARKTGTPWAVYIADAQTGHLETVLNDARNMAYPDWSPDGKSIIFGSLPASMEETSQPRALSLVSLTAHMLSIVPGSEDLVYPRWSPDGRRMLALSADQTTLMLYTAATQTWQVALRGHFDLPAWSTDNKSVFYRDSIQPRQPLLRLHLGDGGLERVADLNTLKITNAIDYQFVGLLPGDVPLVKARLSAADLYFRHLPD